MYTIITHETHVVLKPENVSLNGLLKEVPDSKKDKWIIIIIIIQENIVVEKI